MNTRSFRLDKLVHDGIVQDNLDQGGLVSFVELEEDELLGQLEEKLKEEHAELQSAKTAEDKANEQQDINNILFALGRLGSGDFTPTKTFKKNILSKQLHCPKIINGFNIIYRNPIDSKK